jgi:hypothetical protein
MACGGANSVVDQVGRRSANTALAVAHTAPSCASDTRQCWVERLVRTGCASIAKAPSASAAA